MYLPILAGDPTAPQCAEPIEGFQRGCMFTPVWSDTNIAQPSASGDWTPGAYDPRTGYLFFATEVATRKFSPTGRISIVGSREYGLITPIDFRTNKKVWQAEAPYAAGFGSGVLATVGGLLLHGGSDGFLRVRFQNRTGVVALLNRFWRGRACGDIRNRWRAICRDRCRRQPRRAERGARRSRTEFQARWQVESAECSTGSRHCYQNCRSSGGGRLIRRSGQ